MSVHSGLAWLSQAGRDIAHNIGSSLAGVVYPVDYGSVYNVTTEVQTRFCAIRTGSGASVCSKAVETDKSYCSPDFSHECSKDVVGYEAKRFSRLISALPDSVKEKLPQLSSYDSLLDPDSPTVLLDRGTVGALIEPLETEQIISLLEVYTTFPGMAWTGVPSGPNYVLPWPNADNEEYLSDLPIEIRAVMLELNMMHISNFMFRITDDQTELFGRTIVQFIDALRGHITYIGKDDISWLFEVAVFHASSLRSPKLNSLIDARLYPKIITNSARRSLMDSVRNERFFISGTNEKSIIEYNEISDEYDGLADPKTVKVLFSDLMASSFDDKKFEIYMQSHGQVHRLFDKCLVFKVISTMAMPLLRNTSGSETPALPPSCSLSKYFKFKVTASIFRDAMMWTILGILVTKNPDQVDTRALLLLVHMFSEHKLKRIEIGLLDTISGKYGFSAIKALFAQELLEPYMNLGILASEETRLRAVVMLTMVIRSQQYDGIITDINALSIAIETTKPKSMPEAITTLGKDVVSIASSVPVSLRSVGERVWGYVTPFKLFKN